MRTIKLSIDSRTGAGGAHTCLIIDGQDTGRLYLNPEEYDLLTEVLQTGARELKHVSLQVEEPDNEIDFDIFED
jgi:hypothetical protein